MQDVKATHRIGFIGLGNMGRHMARRLVEAGYDTTVFDVNSQGRASLEALGAHWVESARAVADHCDIVLVSLPTPAVVEQVLAGTNGVVTGTRARIVIDLSTTGPAVSEQIGMALEQAGKRLLDAPVSGGTPGAQAGTLAIMVSGDPEAYEQARDLLSVIGKNLFYLGPTPGQGQMMKIINNTLAATAALVSFEGMVLGAKAGLDAKTMLDIINVSSGRSYATEVKIPECILNRSFPMRFATELLHKDVKLCTDEAERLGVSMEVGNKSREMLADAIAKGEGKVDYAVIIKRLESIARTQFGAAPAGTV